MTTSTDFRELYLDGLSGRPVDPSRLCRACLPVVGMERAAILAVVDGSRPETAGASDAVAADLSALQVGCGDGPAAEVLARGGPVLVADLAGPAPPARWPLFSAAHGPLTGALYCLPLHRGAMGVGALTLTRTDTTPLTSSEFATVVDTAEAITTLLLLAGRSDGPGGARPPATGTWPYDNPLTAEVHQATGMVLAQLDVTISEAYLRLRAHAFAHDRTLAQVAHDVVTRRLRLPADPAGPDPAP